LVLSSGMTSGTRPTVHIVVVSVGPYML